MPKLTTNPKLAIVVLAILPTAACSIKRMAVNKIGDALSSGGSTYESDEDLELVRGALPFGLKLMESLLAESPKHRGLLLSACQGFTTYSYLYVQQEADRLADRDMDGAEKLRTRARRLFLRAHRYGFRALETQAPGIEARMTQDPELTVKSFRKRTDVPLLYWNAAALGLAISVSKNDASMLARLPEVDALVGRALELDEAWNAGATHEFELTLAAAKPGTPDFGAIERHYQRAVELSKGSRASAHVAYAEAVAIPKQDRKSYRTALEKALEIDASKYPEFRVANLAAQERARWLLEQIDERILPEIKEEEKK
jgi:predicted anti-sigma-YlaC factor YlaD